MPISAWDGRFALECWGPDASDDEDGQCEYGDDVSALRARADHLIEAGHFTYIELTGYNAETDEWDALEEWGAD